MNNFDFKAVEEKWKKFHEENNTYYTDVYDFSKPKYYVLGMFPYPSGVALHVGHPLGYVATDVVARFKRMKGFNVLHPMGFDSFGLPSEQYAIDTGNNPAEFTNKNIEKFIMQLKNIGLSYDWSKKISTCDPKYYKWTQWIFKRLFEKNLARKENFPVNWCEELGTVLSNDEIIDGKSERGGYPVTKKNMNQWVIDIPKYAEKLLEGLEKLDWPESTKEIQRNWIGKSEGAIVYFDTTSGEKISVFTTRPDTIYGVTYVVLAPENDLVLKLSSDDKKEEVINYINKTKSKSDIERSDTSKEKTGVFIGAYAINPVNNKKVKIFISDYVLNSYATGAVMAVPSEDERDKEFSKVFNIEEIKVKDDDGLSINSGVIDGLNKDESIKRMIDYLEEKGFGERKVNYKLREWIFTRQRYWGEPIPILEGNGELIALKDSELPLILPLIDDYKPTKNGESALARATEWVNVSLNGKNYKRETSTMPGSAGSSWYFLRFIDSNNDQEFANYELLKHWMPVDLYIGGAEHATGHLLYSRMWNRFLYEEGLSPVDEPFKKLFHQGMLLGSNGIKMGKRYKEFVINPDDVIKTYGADTLRCYQMFMGPLEADKPWSNHGIEGIKKFLDRIYRLSISDKIKNDENKNLEKIYHKTIKKVTEDYEALAFNTAISQLMILLNEFYKEEIVPREYFEGFIKLLHPVAPFITEEIASVMFNIKTLAYEKFPDFDKDKVIDDEIEIGVQVNGKLRSSVVVRIDESEDKVFERVFADEKIIKNLENKEIIKKIYVKGKIVNIVAK